jgi:hypothetical protein
MIIKSPMYEQRMSESSQLLTMKHPVYCLPNSLTILRKYQQIHESEASAFKQKMTQGQTNTGSGQSLQSRDSGANGNNIGLQQQMPGANPMLRNNSESNQQN